MPNARVTAARAGFGAATAGAHAGVNLEDLIGRTLNQRVAEAGAAQLPYAFTEHGAIQTANVLASAQAVEMGIYMVRAFVHLRQAAWLHADLAKRLAELDEKTELLELSHDTFSRSTRALLRQVFDVLRELMVPPDPPKRSVGFVTPEEKKEPKATRSRKKT